MAYKFLHIGFAFSGPPRVVDLEPIFNGSDDDWIRYSATSWIVWTQRSANDWYLVVQPHIGPQEQVLVVGLDMNERSGWLTKSIWDWIDIRRGIHNRSFLDAIMALSPPKLPGS